MVYYVHITYKGHTMNDYKTILEQLDRLDRVGILYKATHSFHDRFHLAIMLPSGYSRDEDDSNDPITILIFKGIKVVRYNSYSFDLIEAISFDRIVPYTALLNDIVERCIYDNWNQAIENYTKLKIREADFNAYLDSIIAKIQEEPSNQAAVVNILKNLVILGRMTVDELRV